MQKQKWVLNENIMMELQLWKKQINLLKHHIWSHIIWYDYYEFFKILVKCINDGVATTRKSWKPSSNLTIFKQEIEHIVLFIDVAINPDMLALDFGDIPPCIRSRILEQLGQFGKLKKLILRNQGNSSGQWLFKSTIEDLKNGFIGLKCLQEFSLKQDCNNQILEALSKHCKATLKILDIENSKQINNVSVDYILACRNISQLNKQTAYVW